MYYKLLPLKLFPALRNIMTMHNHTLGDIFEFRGLKVGTPDCHLNEKSLLKFVTVIS